MRAWFSRRVLARSLMLGLAIWSASTGCLLAQEKTPATIIQEATVAGPVDMPYASDRALIAPNMFGPVLGTRWFVVNGPGLGGGGNGGGGATRQLTSILRDSIPSDASFQIVLGTTNFKVLSKDLNFLGAVLPLVDFTGTIPAAPGLKSIPVLEIAAVTAAIQKGLAKQGETATFNAASHAELELVTTAPIYNIVLVYDFITGQPTTLVIVVPNPADGGLAGRNRVSAGSSPLPRDRFIFDYDFVSNGNLYPATPTMNRFVFGFEKTFLNGLASVEFRVPFASTVNSTSANDGTFGSGHGEIGNLFLVLKSVLYSNDNLVFSSGLGLSLPTADDVRLNVGGADLLRIRNEAVIMTPFLAALWTPTDRLFAQSWLGFSFDTNGNPAQGNLDGKGLQTAGRLYDPTTLQLDLQLGYWLIHPRERNGMLRGLAPFVEFHYNQQLQAQNVVSNGPYSLTSSVGQLSEFDLSTGCAAQLGDNASLMLGASFPLSNQQNRFSDWQLGLRLNYFFGPTGRARANLFN